MAGEQNPRQDCRDSTVQRAHHHTSVPLSMPGAERSVTPPATARDAGRDDGHIVVKDLAARQWLGRDARQDLVDDPAQLANLVPGCAAQPDRMDAHAGVRVEVVYALR